MSLADIEKFVDNKPNLSLDNQAVNIANMHI
jgi:hypothetical protein